jgi:hypothetical protein
MDNTLFSRLTRLFRSNNYLVFGSLWCVIFILYLPAVNGGWVSDTVMSLDKLRH